MARKPTAVVPFHAMPDLGDEIDWVPALRPAPVELRGRTVLLRPLDAAADAEPLYAASHPPTGDPAVWTYLFDGPYASPAALRTTLEIAEASADPLFFTIVPLAGERPAGYASLMRITPEHGSIEIGNVLFGTALQRTTAASEAIFLLARHAFDALGYRRLEWKCNALNAPSRAAAERFGFRFEGVFAQHLVVKGRNRDTAWYAITDSRWPAIRAAFEAWLAPENFDAAGSQRRSLRELTAAT
jgi:RimJ/RimL family protein N-acetyltransferase